MERNESLNKDKVCLHNYLRYDQFFIINFNYHLLDLYLVINIFR